MAAQPVDRSIQKIKFLFQLSGINTGRERKWSENFIVLFNIIWVVTDAIGAIAWVIIGVNKGLKFVELTHLAPCFNLGMMGCCKIAFFVAHQKRIHQLVSNIRKMEEDRLTDNAFGHKISKEKTKFLHALITVMMVVNLTVVVLFVCVPLIIIVVKYFKTNELELILPFLDIYPVDCTDLKYWPFGYIHQCYTTIIVMGEIQAVDYLFYICCTHIGIQFTLLYHEAQNVVAERSVFKMRAEDEQLKQRFDELVKWHQEIISSASMLDKAYTNSTLFNYLSSSLIICLTGFNVMELDNKATVLVFATVCCFGMLQIFFLCFFGDMLMDTSTGVSNAVYNCRWYLVGATVSKSAHIIQIRAQKPCKVTAAGFADVNLRAFMRILSSAWSYFALLQTMYNTD